MIFPQQIVAARQIIDEFDATNYALLLAQMQSGKTGTFMLVLCEMIRLGKVDFGVIFSGNRETDLKEQTKQQDSFFNDYEQFLLENGIADISIAKTIKDTKFHVVWGPELKHFVPLGKTIYIWEESHYGQSTKQEVHKFIQRVGIDATGLAPKDGSFVLSVSATPFSEVIDIFRLEQDKPIVWLEPPEQYLSVDKMMKNGQLFFYREDPLEMFEKCLLKYATIPGYAIVRGMAKFLEPIALRNGWATIHYDLTTKKTINLDAVLATQPLQPTIIFIKGMMRMGKQLNKVNVRFVFESSRSKKTDAILQGLLGRCCGYDSRPDIGVYIRQYVATQRVAKLDKDFNQVKQRICEEGKPVRLIPVWTYEEVNLTQEDIVQFVFLHSGAHWTPFRGTNLTGERTHDYDHHVPIRIRLDDANLQVLKTGDTDARREMLCLHLPESIATHSLSVIHYRGDKNGICTKKLKLARESGLFERLESAVAMNEPFERAGPGLGVVPGEVSIFSDGNVIYITYATHSKKNPVLGRTTGREVFAHKHKDLIHSNGGFNIDLPASIATNRDDFVDTIGECIQLWRDAKFVAAPNFISPNKFGIVLNADIFEQIKPGGAIFQEFKCRGITLSYKPTGNDSSGLGGVRLNQISWQESDMECIPVATPIDEPNTEYIIEGILKGSSF